MTRRLLSPIGRLFAAPKNWGFGCKGPLSMARAAAGASTRAVPPEYVQGAHFLSTGRCLLAAALSWTT